MCYTYRSNYNYCYYYYFVLRTFFVKWENNLSLYYIYNGIYISLHLFHIHFTHSIQIVNAPFRLLIFVLVGSTSAGHSFCLCNFCSFVSFITCNRNTQLDAIVRQVHAAHPVMFIQQVNQSLAHLIDQARLAIQHQHVQATTSV